MFLVVVGGKIEDTLCDQYECREALALELSVQIILWTWKSNFDQQQQIVECYLLKHDHEIQEFEKINFEQMWIIDGGIWFWRWQSWS